MKRFALILAAALVLSSCAVTRDRVVETAFLDFRPYTEAGFFLSPDPYPGEFDALGEILITVSPAIYPKTAKPVTPRKYTDGVYGGDAGNSSSSVYTEKISGDELVEMLYKKAVELGADGIADFECKPVYEYLSRVKFLDHYEVSGLAIRRK